MLQPSSVTGTAPILVPVDLSAASYEPLQFAAQLAACSSQSLVILHVVHDDFQQPNIYPRMNDIEQLLPIEEIAERVFQDFVAGMRKRHPDNAVLANAELILVCGLPATRIIEVARQIGADHIVMGSNSRNSLSELIWGSVSRQVIQQSPVPVTIAHSSKTFVDDASIDVHQSEHRHLRDLTETSCN